MKEKIHLSFIKTITVLLLLSTITIAAVEVVDPIETKLEPQETLDLTEKLYSNSENIIIKIEKNEWENVTSEEFEVSTREVNEGEKLRISLRETPEEEGIHNSTITFTNKEGETQTNYIKYDLVDRTPLINLQYPIKEELGKETTHIGKVAPGQEIIILVEKDRGRGLTFDWETASIKGLDHQYQEIPRDKDLEEILPEQTIEERGIDGLLISIRAIAPRQTGEHEFELSLGGSALSSTSRNFTIEVDDHAYRFDMKNTSKTAGERSEIKAKIKSNSIAIEKFTYEPIALPKDWVEGEEGRTEKEIQVNPGETKEFNLPIRINQEGRYTSKYSVTDSRDNFVIEQESIIDVKPTIRSKIGGFGEGHSLTLPILQPFYSLLNLFS